MKGGSNEIVLELTPGKQKLPYAGCCACCGKGPRTRAFEKRPGGYDLPLEDETVQHVDLEHVSEANNKLCTACYTMEMKLNKKAAAAPPPPRANNKRVAEDADVADRNANNNSYVGNVDAVDETPKKTRLDVAVTPRVEASFPLVVPNETPMKPPDDEGDQGDEGDESSSSVFFEHFADKVPVEDAADDSESLIIEMSEQSSAGSDSGLFEIEKEFKAAGYSEQHVPQQVRFKRAVDVVVVSDEDDGLLRDMEVEQEMNDEAVEAPKPSVSEASALVGQMLKSDLELRTTMGTCAVCSESMQIVELKTTVLRKAAYEATVELDPHGCTELDLDLCRINACSACWPGTTVSMKRARWNVNGFGIFQDGDLRDVWMSEESLVSTVIGVIPVKHSGAGAYSEKQEAMGWCYYFYNNVLGNMTLLVATVVDSLKNELPVLTLSVGWVRDGVSVGGAQLMNVRARVCFKLFLFFWKTSESYRRQCLQNGDGLFAEKTVSEELCVQVERLLVDGVTENGVSSADKGSWHWCCSKNTDNNPKVKVYFRTGPFLSDGGGVKDVELFVRTFPCMFPSLGGDDCADLAKQMTLQEFSRHLILLSDNRLCRHDRALFVLDALLKKRAILTATLPVKVPSFATPLADFTKLYTAMQKSVDKETRAARDAAKAKQASAAAKAETAACSAASAAAAAAKEDDGEGLKVDKEGGEVNLLLSVLALLAKRVPGHPMGRSGFRKSMKALHRSISPGTLWLTVNIGDKKNDWLKKMYEQSALVTGINEEMVKSGAVTQAIFFHSYVETLIDVVLPQLFGEMEWAGGTVEWCMDGTSHLHLIGAIKATSPAEMQKCFESEQAKASLEKWVQEHFCECNDHSVSYPDEASLMRMMQRDQLLLHSHTAVCTKYHKEGSVQRCRFGYGRQKEEWTEIKLDPEEHSWTLKLKRDDDMALCHSDQLFEVHEAAGGFESFHQFTQLFGSSGADGHRIILYMTNYTTKLGLSRLELKQKLLEHTGKAIAKYGQSNTGVGKWADENRIGRLMRLMLLMHVAETPVTQAQAAMNCMGLSEFYCTHDNDKIVTLYSPPYVDFLLQHINSKKDPKKKLKLKPKPAEATAMEEKTARDTVKSYMMRGKALEKESPYSLARKGWTEVKKPEGASDDENHVSFLDGFSPLWWFARVAKKKRSSDKTESVVCLVRRKQYIVDEKLRNVWAVVMATPWRRPDELTNRTWLYFVSENSQNLHVVAMNKLLQNEICLSQKETREKEEGDIIEKGEKKKKKKGTTKKAKNPLDGYHVTADVRVEKRKGAGDEDDGEVMEVGGERGHAAVVDARIAGLIPSKSITAVVERADLEGNEQIDEEDSLAFVMGFDKYKEVSPPLEENKKRKKDNNEEGGDNDDDDDKGKALKKITPNVMGIILNQWKSNTEAFVKGNPQHKAALLTAVLYLANNLVGMSAPPFSMVVQGSGGTGKTMTVLLGVKSFLAVVCTVTKNQQYAKCLLVLAPTNLVAKAIDGKTIDSGLYNRRVKKVITCSKVVKLVLVDEFSMVSLAEIGEIDVALQGNLGRKVPFGGASVMWIGDVHQLPPVMGMSVYNPLSALEKGPEQEGRLLWTGEKWKAEDRASLCVVMTVQYRMKGELAVICENFANGLQTPNNANTLSARVLKKSDDDKDDKAMLEQWKTRWESGGYRLLCTDNNSKAGLNWELAMTMRDNESWIEWKPRDGTKGKESDVVDQMEPKQYAWRGMPVVCLQNHQGTDVVNGAQCVVVHVVTEEGNDMPRYLLLVSASTMHEAQNKMGDKTLEQLLHEHVIVPVSAEIRDGRKAFPVAPLWCMTLHKVQGMTLDGVVLNLSGVVSASLVYTALSRVRNLESLWFLQNFSPSLFVALDFSRHVRIEMMRLKMLQQATVDYLENKLIPPLSFLSLKMQEGEWLEAFRDSAAAANSIGEQEVQRQQKSLRDEQERSSAKQNAQKLSCDPVTHEYLLGRTAEMHWIERCTINGCSAWLMVKAKELLNSQDNAAIEALEDKELQYHQRGYEAAQLNQIQRVLLVKYLYKNTGNYTTRVWDAVTKKEYENRWKQIFGSKTRGQVMPDEMERKRKQK